MSVYFEYRTVWSNGSIEFENDLEIKQYYSNNNIEASESGDEFVKLQKVIVKNK